MIGGSQHLYLFICKAGRPVVIQDSLDMVTPFRIDADPVDEPFGRPAVANEEHMLLIIAVGPQGAQEDAYRYPLCFQQDDIGRKECQNHLCGEIAQMAYEPSQAKKYERKEHKADDIGLADIGQFRTPSLNPFGHVQMETGI